MCEKSESGRRHRLKAQELFMDGVVTLSPFSDFLLTEDSAMRNALPENVHLLTLEKVKCCTYRLKTSIIERSAIQVSNGRFLLRLEHIFDVKEDKELSRPAEVDLNMLFADFEVSNVVELALGGNVERSRLKRLHWNVEGTNEIPPLESSRNQEAETTSKISLEPMQIRTFLADLRKRPKI